MLAYLVRRLLLMIPTLFGIMVLLWAVMSFSPGEPQPPGAGAFGSDPTQNLKDLESQNRNVRLFREQFGLNRPRFWNGWTRLAEEEVAEELRVAFEGIPTHPPARVKRAKRALEDWGDYAVPALVALLGRTTGDLQTFVLVTLRKAAYTLRTIHPAGYVRSEEEKAEEERAAARNARIMDPGHTWAADAAPEARAAVVARWEALVSERRAAEGAWSWGPWERFWVGLTDTQFGRYFGRVLTGDLGTSSQHQKPVWTLIRERLVYSLSLAVPSFLIAWVLAVLLGVTSAANHRNALDHGIGLSLFVLYSLPAFVVATVLQRKVAGDWGWFPTSGFQRTGAQALTTWEHFKDVLWHVTLPIVCYTYGSLAYIARQARSGMLEVLKSDYVRTARAKGLAERDVIWRHAVRNGMMPIVTLLGTALPILLGGSVIVEYVFDIEGFGQLMLNAIFQKDYNVVMGVEILTAILTLVGLLLTDVIYALMDPRIRYA